jgi:two-component system, NtrC family, response regulator AtoC
MECKGANQSKKMEKFKIFIVDDDPWYGEILEYHLSKNPDYELKRFLSAGECMGAIGERPDLVTVDYSLVDSNGGALLEKIKQYDDGIAVIIVSGQKDISTAIGLLKAGASDYFVKDDNTKDLLWNAVLRIRENSSLKKEVEKLKDELGRKFDLGKMIKGNSPAITKVFTLIEKAAKTNINVSITGETGTGKEVVAKAIHHNSDRKKKPFVAINMAAIPKELIESELFGYEKGAFTGANSRKSGRFEEADKGTLFLDEIAEMDLGLQAKLLRVLQERELTRVGGSEIVPLDVRVIIASHKNLGVEVSKGNFREDLYYRVAGMPIALPPLRERGNDLLILAKYFLEEFCKQNGMKQVSFSEGAREKLQSYNYPGNIRELKSIVELSAVMCNDNEILPGDISFHAISTNKQLLSEEKTLKQYDNEIISFFLRKYENNVITVAKKLDIGKTTIYRLIKDKEISL